MSHVYSVNQCLYTTISDPNPWCILYGSVDGFRVNPIVYYDLIAQADTVAGADGVRAVLAPLLLNAISVATPLDGHTLSGPPFLIGPIFSAVVPPATPGTN